MRKRGRREGLVYACGIYVSKLGRVMQISRAGLYFTAEGSETQRGEVTRQGLTVR